MADTPKFETSLEELEKLVGELEDGDLDLDEALKRFEKGVKLSKHLNASLEEANRKVEKLMIAPDGSVESESLDPGAEEAPAKKLKAKKGKESQDKLF